MLASHRLVRAFSARLFKSRSLFFVALVLAFMATARAEQGDERTPATPDPYRPAVKMEGLPIPFEPNVKQTDARYKFLVHQNGLAMGFMDRSIEVRLAT